MKPFKTSRIASSASPMKSNGPRFIVSLKSGIERALTASSIPAAALANSVATKNIGAARTPMYTMIQKIDWPLVKEC